MRASRRAKTRSGSRCRPYRLEDSGVLSWLLRFTTGKGVAESLAGKETSRYTAVPKAPSRTSALQIHVPPDGPALPATNRDAIHDRLVERLPSEGVGSLC